jgi:hypothetical protein
MVPKLGKAKHNLNFRVVKYFLRRHLPDAEGFRAGLALFRHKVGASHYLYDFKTAVY